MSFRLADNAAKEPRRHVVISGTGRAGTSFLVCLLTRLGLDTGFSEADLALDECSRAGLERDIRKPAPYIAKAPWLCVTINEVLERDDIVIEHAIIPLLSRRHTLQPLACLLRFFGMSRDRGGAMRAGDLGGVDRNCEPVLARASRGPRRSFARRSSRRS